MVTQSSPDDVLRFGSLRQPNEGPESSVSYQLLSTNLSGRLASVARDERQRIAADWFEDTGATLIDDLSENDIYKQILETVTATLRESESPTIRTVFENLSSQDLFEDIPPDDRGSLTERLSDVLLASYYAPRKRPENLDDIETVFRLLLLLKIPDRKEISTDDLSDEGAHVDFLDRDFSEALDRLTELPDSLEAEIRRKYSIGIADLMVVKQHIKRYEPVEIAHIENVMESEQRERNHRRLDRSEEIFTTERETEVQKESELETAERFEMSEETSRTVKEDQKLKFGLSLSGKYGPIKFSSDFQFGRSRSRTERTSSSTSYAKDTVERSLKRVRDRVRRKRTTRILEEVEETNLHAFNNSSDDHIIGIYQFVDKVFQSQVFNYGKREMFDLAVPEPASYLWHRRRRERKGGKELEEPEEPDPLNEGLIPHLDKNTDHGDAQNVLPDDISDSSEVKVYEALAAKYRSTELEPPPDEEITVTLSEKYPKADGSDDGENISTNVIETSLPKDYRPTEAQVSAIAHSREEGHKHELTTVGFGLMGDVSIRDIEDGRNLPDFAIPYETEYLNMSQVEGIGRNDEIMLFGMSDPREFDIGDGSASRIPAEEPLKIGVFAYDTQDYVVNITIDCEVTKEAMQRWRLKTFDKLKSAYEDRLLEYKEELARYKQEQEQREEEENTERGFGTSPSRKEEIIRGELKKHCTEIITEDFFSKDADSPVMVDEGDDPPTFHFERAREHGGVARFFEQAFEWEHIQYVFYPYYWARDDLWDERFDEDDPAHQFRQFLQAGWARVVVPVRPGFEDAVHYYLLTGDVWMGRDTPPGVGDDLHLSIAEEIRSRTEEGVLEATPVGSPWEVRVPTSLVRLSDSPSLPKWERVEPEEDAEPKDYWNWRPVDSGE